MKINFFAGENKFIYGRKFHGMREEIFQHAEAKNRKAKREGKESPTL